jgi:hypothetical protein
VVTETAAVELWTLTTLSKRRKEPPLSDLTATLRRLRERDLEPEPSDAGCRIKEGVARDRQIALSDAEMRHGRKPKARLSTATRAIRRYRYLAITNSSHKHHQVDVARE